MMNLQISKAENGFLITVGGDTAWMGRDARFVFNTWEAAAVFLASLNERLK
jgi:hypothetical protein